MQKSIDEAAQSRRRKDAFQSALSATVFLSVSAGVKLALCRYYQMHGILGVVLVILSVLALGRIIPVWILLKRRLKEIEGGEEDAAAQY